MSKKGKNKTAARPTDAIEFKAETDGVKLLTPCEYHSFLFNVKCTQCGCVRSGIRIEDEEHDVEGSRGTASFVMKCKDCQRQCKVSYTGASFAEVFSGQEAQDYSDWSRVITLDCRGCGIDSVTCDAWKVTSESDNVYDWNADEDFFEYDADLEKPVTVSGLTFRVVPI